MQKIIMFTSPSLILMAFALCTPWQGWVQLRTKKLWHIPLKELDISNDPKHDTTFPFSFLLVTNHKTLSTT